MNIMLLKRLTYFSIAFTGCLAVRFIITHFILGHSKTLVMDNVGGGWDWAVEMLKWEFGGWPHMNSIFWAHSGLFVALWFLPFKTLEDKGVLSVLILFYVALTYTPFVARCHLEGCANGLMCLAYP